MEDRVTWRSFLQKEHRPSSVPQPLVDRIDELRGEPMTPGAGIVAAAGQSIVEFVRARRMIHDLATPVPVLRWSALEHNASEMAAWCEGHGVTLSPHAKTSMAPQLLALQLAMGASGFVVAGPAQLRTLNWAGIHNVALANELTQPAEIAWVVAQLRENSDFRFSCWVDSVATAQLLNRAAQRAGVKIDVLLEIGWRNGRCGTRTLAESFGVAEEVRNCGGLRLIGLSGYEGVVSGSRSSRGKDEVVRYLDHFRSTASRLSDSDLFCPDVPITLTAGGSMFFDLVAEQLSEVPGAHVVLRSGSYLIHDHGMFYKQSPLAGCRSDPLIPALTVWGTVLAIHGDHAYLDAGRRSVGSDQGLPQPLRVWRDGLVVAPDGWRTVAVNDEHAFLERERKAATLMVGDRVELGISHPCTTIDRYRYIPVQDDDGVIVDVIRTLF